MTSVHADKSLLPTSRAPWEQALSLTSAEFRDTDTAALLRAFDPYQCPEAMLPWLAHTLSVDFWRSDWSVAKKRRVIATAVRMQFAKGTEQGLRDYVTLTDSRVRSILVRPQRVFSGKSLSREERERWLAGLPQIRVWSTSLRTNTPRSVFTGRGSQKTFIRKRFLSPSTAGSRMSVHAGYTVGGVEQSVRVVQLPLGFRVHLRGTVRRGVFSGRLTGGHYQPSTASIRILTVAPTLDRDWRNAVVPSFEPVRASPELIHERGSLPRSVFSGRPIGDRYLTPSRASLRVYQRYAVSTGITERKPWAVQFNNTGRFGLPAHTAVVSLRVPSTRSRFAAGQGVLVPHKGFWIPHDPEPIQTVREAIVASMRVSDTILLRLGPTRTFIAGQPLIADVDTFYADQPSE